MHRFCVKHFGEDETYADFDICPLDHEYVLKRSIAALIMALAFSGKEIMP